MLIPVLGCGQVGRDEVMANRGECRFTMRRALASLLRGLTRPLVARAPASERPGARTGGAIDQDLLDEMAIW